MAVLSDKGAVCSDPLCRQRDFLPFQCSTCNNVFCVEHYLPDCHSCPNKGICDRRVYVCPACLDVVRMVELETDGDAARRHGPQCKPELRAQREKQRKGRTCPVKGCKERLTAISSINCPHCHVDVCIKHRLKEDHNCDILKATRKDSKRNYLLRQLSSNSSKGMKMRWHSSSSSSEESKDRKVRPHKAYSTASSSEVGFGMCRWCEWDAALCPLHCAGEAQRLLYDHVIPY